MRKDSNVRQEKGRIVSFIPTGEYYYSKGVQALKRRDLHKAKKYLSRAFDLEPLEPLIACQLAVVETELNNFSEANGLLHFILDDLDPYMVECHYFLANNYAHMGMFQEAYKHVSIYLEKERDGEYIEDAEELLELIALDSDEELDFLGDQDELITLQEEARFLLEAGSFTKAIEKLEELIENHDDFWPAYNNLALAYFYLGEKEQAHAVLNEVFAKNPGNLHAICNLAVFLYYEKNEGALQPLLDTLRKVKPISFEHQFKLGATFSLVGQFDDSYRWLKKLYKTGFEGDPGFYYWLSHSAYHTGHMQTAKAAWKYVLEMNPEKEGSEPWNEQKRISSGFEHRLADIIGYLNDEREEARMFGIFLLSLTDERKTVISHPGFCDIETLGLYEKVYLAQVLGMKVESMAEVESAALAHETAVMLYKRYQPIHQEIAGLFLLWFSIFSEMIQNGDLPKNSKALAGAVDYIWNKLRDAKRSQKDVAEEYGVSLSTMQKYVKHIRSRFL